MKLLNIQNRLVIIFNNQRYSFPAAYKFEVGQVVIWSLDDTTLSFKAPLDEVLDVNNDSFASIDALETFLLPLLGFNTASGGSEVGEGVFETENGIAVSATATGSGTAIKAVRSSGLAAQFVGKQLIEQEDSGSNNDSSILEVNSTVLGSLPAPRMTTAQKEGISFPATGLLVYDLNRVRYEQYDGIRWVGLRRFVQSIQHTSFGPSNSTTVAFGSFPSAPVTATTSPAPYEMKMSGSGVITGCYLPVFVAGTIGTGEPWSLYIRHNGTDYLVATITSTSTVRIFENYLLNIPYVDGDIVRMIYVNPSSGNRPSGVTAAGHLITQ